ncbi:hypothetical protein [Arthrobacter sp. Ld5]|uniref:hypothetical protein n=1 Tax=Arthrobacter sp. Ld5 TaxID=649152 RepID=UPI003EBDD554
MESATVGLSSEGDEAQQEQHDRSEYVVAARQEFVKCPNVSGLRVTSVVAGQGYLTAQFEGPMGDFRGPYGIIVRLPTSTLDPLWAEHTSAGDRTVQGWVRAAIITRTLRAHRDSQDGDRGYTPDDVWWLIDDKTTQQAQIITTDIHGRGPDMDGADTGP